ncbi:MAG: hypothetical protein HQ503_14590 [Rhodospirillales bacterium]|nr:hypothetical protein [Rhodospirillales bacterium]
MNFIARKYLKLWILGATCILIGILIYSDEPQDIQLMLGEELKPNVIQTDVSDNQISGTVRLPNLEDLDQVIERPLFIQNRRPQPPLENKKKHAQADGQIFRFELSGVVISSGRRIALMRKNGAKIIRYVRVGESVDNWLVTDITANYVILKKGDESQTIKLVDPLGKSVRSSMPSGVQGGQISPIAQPTQPGQWIQQGPPPVLPNNFIQNPSEAGTFSPDVVPPAYIPQSPVN